MEDLTERDLEHAADFREGVHREALEQLRRVHPEITLVVDRYPVEAYFQQHWDYPGRWYTIVAIPEESGSRKKLVETIVRDTLSQWSREAADPPPKTDKPAAGKRAETAPAGPALYPDDPFYALIAGYDRCVVDYCIIAADPRHIQGGEEHRRALELAFRKLNADSADDPDGWELRYDVSRARGTRIDAEELFTQQERDGHLTYRQAFLAPPHGSGCTGADFARVNAALFPKGAAGLEVYEWTTDWSDYFDDGHEWWGALCLSVYDRNLDRFVVILASATD